MQSLPNPLNTECRYNQSLQAFAHIALSSRWPGPAPCHTPSCDGGSWRCLEVERVTRQARRMESQGEQCACMGLSSVSVVTTDSSMTVETRFISGAGSTVTVSTGADHSPAGSICPHSFHVNDVYVLMCLSILYLPGLTQCSHSHRSPISRREAASCS